MKLSEVKTKEDFEKYVKEYPSYALEYASNSSHWTKELFEYCAKEYPWTTLKYAPNSPHWAKELFAYCTKEYPWWALYYASNSPHWTPELFTYVKYKDPTGFKEAFPSNHPIWQKEEFMLWLLANP